MHLSQLQIVPWIPLSSTIYREVRAFLIESALSDSSHCNRSTRSWYLLRSLPFSLLPISALLFSCKEGYYQVSTRPLWLHYSWLNCLQSLVHVKMAPALLNTASPHPPPPAAKDQSQWQVPEVWSSIGSHSLKWRITWMMPLLQILWPSSEEFQKTHLASPHSCLTWTHIINVLQPHVIPVEKGSQISLRSVSLDSLRTHEISPSLYSKDHMCWFAVAIYELCTIPCW